MHRFFRFLLPALLGLAATGCATTSTEERLTELEGQSKHQQVLDLRISHVEDRLTAVETTVGELADSKGGKGGKGRTPARRTVAPVAAAPRPASPANLASPATPRTTGVREDAPLDRPSPNLTLAKAQADQPRLSPAGLLTDYFSTPQARPVPAGAADKTLPPSPAASAAPAPVAGPAATPAVSGQAAAGPGLVPLGLDAPGPRPVSKTPPPAPSRPAGPTGKSGYDAALARYNKGDYAGAEKGFAAFLQSSPGSPLAANALYWQGECQYSLGKYDNAIMLFQNVATKYPKHDKAAAALLKVGYSYERLRDMDNARFYWQILLDDFPHSAPAELARKRMAGA